MKKYDIWWERIIKHPLTPDQLNRLKSIHPMPVLLDQYSQPVTFQHPDGSEQTQIWFRLSSLPAPAPDIQLMLEQFCDQAQAETEQAWQTRSDSVSAPDQNASDGGLGQA